MSEEKCKFIKKCVNFKDCENLLSGDCHINELSIRCKNDNKCKYFIVYEQLQTAKEEIQAYKEDRFCQGGCTVYQFDKIKQLKEENEKLKECFIPLNQKKYYCSKEVYNILEDTKNEWQMVTQLESERVMEITKLERENKHLTQQNKQMRKALEKIKEYCSKNDSITWFDYDNIEEIIQQTLNKGVE